VGLLGIMSESIKSQALPVAGKTPIQIQYDQLNEKCGAILTDSLHGTNGIKIARSHQLVQEIEDWTTILNSRREIALLKMVAHEYQFALLALAQGHYRHAFKGLRLVLELTLQSVHLSAHELDLREWLQNRKDTIWGTLVDDSNGVLSVRFARSFFSSLDQHIPYHRALAEQVYRECSECVHGNIPKHIPLPASLAFSKDSFDLWHAKADVIAMLCHFTLSMRYLQELPTDAIAKLETSLLARLGHIQEVRVALGGPQGG
jgi:hypothetical protein